MNICPKCKKEVPVGCTDICPFCAQKLTPHITPSVIEPYVPPKNLKRRNTFALVLFMLVVAAFFAFGIPALNHANINKLNARVDEAFREQNLDLLGNLISELMGRYPNEEDSIATASNYFRILSGADIEGNAKQQENAAKAQQEYADALLPKLKTQVLEISSFTLYESPANGNFGLVFFFVSHAPKRLDQTQIVVVGYNSSGEELKTLSSNPNSETGFTETENARAVLIDKTTINTGGHGRLYFRNIWNEKPAKIEVKTVNLTYTGSDNSLAVSAVVLEQAYPELFPLITE